MIYSYKNKLHKNTVKTIMVSQDYLPKLLNNSPSGIVRRCENMKAHAYEEWLDI